MYVGDKSCIITFKDKLIAFGDEEGIELKYNEMKSYLNEEDLKFLRLYCRLNKEYCKVVVNEALSERSSEFIFMLNRVFNSNELYKLVESSKRKVSGL